MLSFLYALIGTAIVLTLVVTSTYMGFVAARSNGWRTLAESYRHRGRPPSNRLRFQSATLNGYSFPGTMQVAATGVGLWLRPQFLLFHPPLLVPWEQLESHRLDGRFAGVRLEAADPVRFALELGEPTRALLLEDADESLLEARAALLETEPIVPRR